jgi:hypothetical protein
MELVTIEVMRTQTHFYDSDSEMRAGVLGMEGSGWAVRSVTAIDRFLSVVVVYEVER